MFGKKKKVTTTHAVVSCAKQSLMIWREPCWACSVVRGGPGGWLGGVSRTRLAWPWKNTGTLVFFKVGSAQPRHHVGRTGHRIKWMSHHPARINPSTVHSLSHLAAALSSNSSPSFYVLATAPVAAVPSDAFDGKSRRRCPPMPLMVSQDTV